MIGGEQRRGVAEELLEAGLKCLANAVDDLTGLARGTLQDVACCQREGVGWLVFLLVCWSVGLSVCLSVCRLCIWCSLSGLLKWTIILTNMT